MTKELSFIGVPTSAGAHHAGQDLAPDALRAAGLIERLLAAGLAVVDAGDVAGEVFAADRPDAVARNIDSVVRVADAVAAAVERESRAGRLPIVVGGDCTITLGVVAGLQRTHDDVRVAYFDGDADLSGPEHTGSGILDATGIAHLLGIADTPLARIGSRAPMLADHQLVLLGYDQSDPDSYDGAALAGRPDLLHFTDAEVRAAPRAVAQQAVDRLSSPQACIVVHFDVDAVDSKDLPLANFPHYGTGVPLSSAAEVLEVLLSAPGVSAVVLTEVNPTYDRSGLQLTRYIDVIAQALSNLNA
jgi:arginase